MPTTIAPGDTADASGFALSPARGDSRPAVATALRRGYRNCTTLRLLLAGVACASLVFLWAANQSRQNSLAKCDVTPPSGGGGLEVDGRPLRVAVCFFGVARSLRWTLPSVKSRVLDVLTGAGMEVETFVHTYVMKEMMNERTGEMHVDYADYANDYQGLHPNRSLVTNQDEFDLLWPDPLSLTHYRWTYSKAEAPNVIRNVFRAYWSMATVLALMELHSLERGFQYDAVVLARPDVWFHADIDLPRRKFPLPEDTVFLPSFDTDPRSGRRKNDRFAYGSFEVMRVVMNRISTLLDPDAAELPPHTESEGVLGYHLQAHSVSVSCIDFPLSRVRMTGDIPEPDYKRVRKACKSGTDPTACGMQDLGFKFPAAVADESK